MPFFKNKKNQSDEQLLHEYRKNKNLDAIEELYLRYSHLVFFVCMKYLKNEEESKDAVMEIFNKLLSEKQKKEIKNFKNWLFVITRNYCFYQIKKRNRQYELDGEIKKNKTFFMENVEFDTLINSKQNKNDLLNEALKKLPADQKACIQLFYYQNKTYQDISEITGFDLKKVKSCIQNGKRRLKNLLEQNEVFDDD